MTKKLYKYLPSIMAVLIALVIGGLIMITRGVNPINAYIDMGISAFYKTTPKSPMFSGLSKTLLTATPLIFTALSAMIAFKAGLFNIGAAGQMIAGGLSATAWGMIFQNSILGTTPILVLVAIAGGFLWAGIAGFLKAKYGVNEVISTIMLNYIIVEIQNYLLNGIMKDPASQNNQTPKIWEGGRLITIFENLTRQRLNFGFIIAILLVIGVYLLFKYTKLGYEIKTVGYSDSVAENSGISAKKITFIAMGIAGACAGLGGAERVLGGAAQYAYSELIMGDYGFNGLAVALLGKNSPIGIFVASIFYAALDVGGQTLQQRYQVDREIVYIIQALIIIFVAGENLFKRMFKNSKGVK